MVVGAVMRKSRDGERGGRRGGVISRVGLSWVVDGRGRVRVFGLTYSGLVPLLALRLAMSRPCSSVDRALASYLVSSLSMQGDYSGLDGGSQRPWVRTPPRAFCYIMNECGDDKNDCVMREWWCWW